jgi:hypothetical protein
MLTFLNAGEIRRTFTLTASSDTAFNRFIAELTAQPAFA